MSASPIEQWIADNGPLRETTSITFHLAKAMPRAVSVACPCGSADHLLLEMSVYPVQGAAMCPSCGAVRLIEVDPFDDPPVR